MANNVKTYIRVTRTCPICYEDHSVIVREDAYNLFRSPSRPLIQDIFPDLSTSEREILMTGTCPTCYEEMCNWLEEE